MISPLRVSETKHQEHLTGNESAILVSRIYPNRDLTPWYISFFNFLVTY